MPFNDSINDDSAGEPPGQPTGNPRSLRSRVFRQAATLTAGVGLFTGVLAATTMSTASADWREECIGEGCDGEEKEELWESFKHECVSEGCYSEEVAELAGSGIYTDGTYTNTRVVDEMMRWFQTRSSTDVREIAVKPGPTDDLWATIADLLDGVVIGVDCSNYADFTVDSCDPWYD